MGVAAKTKFWGQNTCCESDNAHCTPRQCTADMAATPFNCPLPRTLPYVIAPPYPHPIGASLGTGGRQVSATHQPSKFPREERLQEDELDMKHTTRHALNGTHRPTANLWRAPAENHGSCTPMTLGCSSTIASCAASSTCHRQSRPGRVAVPLASVAILALEHVQGMCWATAHTNTFWSIYFRQAYVSFFLMLVQRNCQQLRYGPVPDALAKAALLTAPSGEMHMQQ
eukprot:10985209-Karenia_brevis.AAC.1